MKDDQCEQTESRWQKMPVANLVRHVESGNYYARIRVRGKLIWKSLKTDRIGVAKLRLTDFQKKERQRAAVNTAVLRGKMTFGQALETYRKRLDGDYSLKERSKVYRQERIAALLKSWPELKGTDVAQISKSDCLSWASRFGQNASPSTFNNTVGTLRLVLDIPVEAGARYDNPAVHVKRKKIRQKLLHLPSHDEFLKLVETMNTWNYQYASETKQVRRTFFSFHYQYDVSRAHVVRNSWVTKEDREDAGFFDASVFESKRRAGDETLKAFLTEAFKGTTVTCVPIGSQTALRPWVRYELVRSFQRGNGMFGVRIHNIKNLQGQCGVAGENPFDLLAYQVANDRVQWQEKNNGSWGGYGKVPTLSLSDVAYDLKGEHHNTFACRFPAYDWVNDNGYQNLGTWIENAAKLAGK